MPTPSKPVLSLVAEGTAHKTKAELEQRKEAEDALTTGVHMQAWDEVKSDKIALKEFERVRDLLQIIEKDDALHEATINRYALLRSECLEFERREKSLTGDMRKAATALKKDKIEFLQYAAIKDGLNKTSLALDRQIQAKRKMLLDIEKENIMTIAAALRSIPKKVEKPEKPERIPAWKRNDG